MVKNLQQPFSLQTLNDLPWVFQNPHLILFLYNHLLQSQKLLFLFKDLWVLEKIMSDRLIITKFLVMWRPSSSGIEKLLAGVLIEILIVFSLILHNFLSLFLYEDILLNPFMEGHIFLVVGYLSGGVGIDQRMKSALWWVVGFFMLSVFNCLLMQLFKNWWTKLITKPAFCFYYFLASKNDVR